MNRKVPLRKSDLISSAFANTRTLNWLTVLLVFITCTGMCAYFIAADWAENELTVGKVETTVTEDFRPPEELKAGESFKKDVKITNSDSCACYVRVKVIFTDQYMEEHCKVDYNKTAFEYCKEDGYWYYKEVLWINESTESLFTTVTIDEGINRANINDFDLQVYAESYQSGTFLDYKTAWKHFKRNR